MTLKRIKAGRGHRYTLDGKRVTGVTTLIKKGLPSPGLVGWAARTVAEYAHDIDPSTLDILRTMGRDAFVNNLKGFPNYMRDSAAQRGTEIHDLLVPLSQGIEVDVPDHLAGYVESCVAFLDEWRIKPILTEVVVANRTHKYAGTLDVVAALPDARVVLFDYKTGKNIYPEVALQLAAYRHAEIYVGADGREQWMEDVGITAGYAVHIREDGYEVIPAETGKDVFGAFLKVAEVARITDAMDGWIGEAETWGIAA